MGKRFVLTKFAADLNRDGRVNYLDVPEWIGWIIMFPGSSILNLLDGTRLGNWIFNFFDVKDPFLMRLLISILVYFGIYRAFVRLMDPSVQTALLAFVFKTYEEFLYKAGFRKRVSAQEKIRLTIKTAPPPTSQSANLVTAENLLRNGEYVRAAVMFVALKKRFLAIDAYRRGAVSDRRLFLEIAQIHFANEENSEGLKACFASGDIPSIVHAARKMRAWNDLIDYMLMRELVAGDMAALGEDFWRECLIQLTPSEKVGTWLARCVGLSGSFVLSEMALEFFQKDPEANGRFLMQLDGRTLDDMVTGLLAQADTNRYPVGFLARCAHGLYVAQLYYQSALLYEREVRPAMAGKCYALSGDLVKGKELLALAREEGMSSALDSFISSLPPEINPAKAADMPKEREYLLRQILSPIDPAVDISHASSPFLLQK